MVFRAYCNPVVLLLVLEKRKILSSLYFLSFSPFKKSPELMGSTTRNRPPRSQFKKNLRWQVVCTSHNADIQKIKNRLQCLKEF